MEDLQTSTAHPSPDLPSTSTSTTDPNYYYDVFINCRGPDVKTGFATALYRRLLSHRLQPFLDKEELQKEEKIDPQINGSIRTASIHIAIFSPRYAESTWCLNELLLILNKSGDTVIPVFYKVQPSDLRWASEGKGQYAPSLNNLEVKGRCNSDELEKWRKALNQVSYIVGFELEAYNGDEAKLLEEVVGCVLKNRGKTPLHVATHPTGLQEKVDDFQKTLLSHQQNSGKARVLGIVGMGGAGKTTLAKEFFNGKSKLLTGLTQRTDQIDSMDDGIEILRRYLRALVQLGNYIPENLIFHSRKYSIPYSIPENIPFGEGHGHQSYDALEEDEKQIFLDIACYFIDKERDTAIKVWDGSGWNGLVGFRNLQDKCLVDVHVVNVIDYHGRWQI